MACHTDKLQTLHEAFEKMYESIQEHRRKIFISSTYDDLKELRIKISNKIREEYFTDIDANRDALGGGITLNVVQNLIGEAYAFVGFYGPRYGDVTRKKDECAPSFSMYEFGLALEKWKDPIGWHLLFLLPRNGSELYNNLKISARDLLLNCKKYKWSETEINNDFEKQAKFTNALLNHGISASIQNIEDVNSYFARKNGDFFNAAQRICKEASTESELFDILNRWLKGLMAIIIYNFEENKRIDLGKAVKDTFKQISEKSNQNDTEFTEQVTIAEEQFHIFDEQSLKKAIPGICILIQGPRERSILSGGLTSRTAHEIFLRLPWRQEADDPEECKMTNRNKYISSIWETIWEAVKPTEPWRGSSQDANVLARALIQANRPIIIVIYNLERVAGGLKNFEESIWFPLFDAIEKQLQSQSHGYCRYILTMLVTHCGPRLQEKKSTGDKASFRSIRYLPYLRRDFI